MVERNRINTQKKRPPLRGVKNKREVVIVDYFLILLVLRVGLDIL